MGKNTMTRYWNMTVKLFTSAKDATLDFLNPKANDQPLVNINETGFTHLGTSDEEDSLL